MRRSPTQTKVSSSLLNCTSKISLDIEVPVKFWKSFRIEVRIRSPAGSEIWIRTLDLDRVRLAGGMRSPSALVTIVT